MQLNKKVLNFPLCQKCSQSVIRRRQAHRVDSCHSTLASDTRVAVAEIVVAGGDGGRRWRGRLSEQVRRTRGAESRGGRHSRQRPWSASARAASPPRACVCVALCATHATPADPTYPCAAHRKRRKQNFDSQRYEIREPPSHTLAPAVLTVYVLC